MKLICRECGQPFPRRFLIALYVSNVRGYKDGHHNFDPECALVIKNRLYGVSETSFLFKHRERIYKKYIAWKEKNE
jgi:hypothetical protein